MNNLNHILPNYITKTNAPQERKKKKRKSEKSPNY